MEIKMESKLKSLPEEVQAVLDDNQFNYKLNIIENFKSTKYKSQLNPLPNALSLGPDGEIYLRKRDNIIENLKSELMQVATVCLRWVDKLEKE